MNRNYFGKLGVLLLTGAIVNDALLIDGITALSWAKILFMFGFIFSLLHGLRRIAFSQRELLVLVYCVGLVMLSFLSGGPGVTDKTIEATISLAIGMFSFFVYNRLKISVGSIIGLFAFWVLLSVALSIPQSIFGVLYFTERVFESGVIPGLYRASGLMSDPNYFALICLIALALTTYAAQLTKWRFFFVVGVILSGSRAGLLVMLAMPFMALFLRHDLKKGVIALAMGGAMFWFAISAQWMPESISMIFNVTSYQEDGVRNSLQDRMLAINAGVVAFENNPIFGYGLGDLIYHPLNLHQQLTHNTFIQVLAESGVIGFLLLLLAFVYQFKKGKMIGVMGSKSSGINDHRSRTAILLLFVFFMMSMTLVVHYSRIMFFVLSIIGLILHAAPTRKTN